MELHTNLERKLPLKILDMVDKSEYAYYPNRCTGYLRRVGIVYSYNLTQGILVVKIEFELFRLLFLFLTMYEENIIGRVLGWNTRFL